MNEDLKLPLLLSTILHLTVILLFTIKAFLFPPQVTFFEPALRVDIVGLPDKYKANEPSVSEIAIKNEEKSEVKKEVPKAEPKEEPEVILSKSKASAKSDDSKLSAADAIKRLKQQLAIDKIKNEMKDKEREALSKKISSYKGNVLSPGTELTGVNKLQHENYLGSLDRHVKQYWSLPEWLAKGDYKAQVRILVDEQGMLLNAQLIKSSGNPAYDEIVLETVKKASPFPIPPEKFKAMVSMNGMVLGFPE